MKPYVFFGYEDDAEPEEPCPACRAEGVDLIPSGVSGVAATGYEYICAGCRDEAMRYWCSICGTRLPDDIAPGASGEEHSCTRCGDRQ